MGGASLPRGFPPPDFDFYVILTPDMLFKVSECVSARPHSLTPRFTHNMGLHVRWPACLYKTTDRRPDQSAAALVIPSRSPWKPVASVQSRRSGGGVWIEVACYILRLAGWPEPEKAGEVPYDYCVSLSEARTHWGIVDVLTECSIHLLDFYTEDSKEGDFSWTQRSVCLHIYIFFF